MQPARLQGQECAVWLYELIYEERGWTDISMQRIVMIPQIFAWKRDSSLDSGEPANSLVLLCSSRKGWEDIVAVMFLTSFQQPKKTA